jgi:hypothetical protein
MHNLSQSGNTSRRLLATGHMAGNWEQYKSMELEAGVLFSSFYFEYLSESISRRDTQEPWLDRHDHTRSSWRSV